MLNFIKLLFILTGVTCKRPTAPAHGHVGGNEVWPARYNAVAIYSCDSGFALIGQDQRHCRNDGRWSGRAPMCKRKEKIVRIVLVIIIHFMLPYKLENVIYQILQRLRLLGTSSTMWLKYYKCILLIITTPVL